MTIPDIVSALAAAPRPVVCLDTCTVLNLIRAGWREPVTELEAGLRLTDIAGQDPPLVLTVVSYLITTEFAQKVAGVQGEATTAVTRAEGVLEAAAALGRPVTFPALLGHPTLVQGLTEAAERLLASAVVIDRDPACVDRAVERVVTRAKPADDGKLNDAVHLEHYLALSRAIQTAGLPCRRAFVSPNTKDFDDPGLTANDFTPADLRYFSRLTAAVGAFRL